MEESNEILRDFIYLDWEKVRSIAAQILQGMPEGKRVESGQERTIQGDIGANFAIIKANVGSDIRYFNSEYETRSLHHYVYSLVEETLKEKEYVLNIDSNFDLRTWTPEFFSDGQFVKITGIIRVLDYNWMQKWIGDLGRIFQTVQHYELMSIKDKETASAKRKEYERSNKEINNLKPNEMQDLIKKLYGDIIRIKVIPNINAPKYLFVGSGSPDLFTEDAASLSQKYGSDINANWSVFGQLNISKEIPRRVMNFPVGNQIEDGIESMIIALNEVQKTATHFSFPAISFTPISIYRTCPHNSTKLDLMSAI